jgi:hypothetical protein
MESKTALALGRQQRLCQAGLMGLPSVCCGMVCPPRVLPRCRAPSVVASTCDSLVLLASVHHLSSWRLLNT